MSNKALLVTATAFEIQPTLLGEGLAGSALSGLGVAGTLAEGESFDCLVTGVGQLQCAAHLSALLARKSYRCVIQAGLAGSFVPVYPKLSVVCVAEEALADLGAESNGSYLDLIEMGLLQGQQVPFVNGVLQANEAGLFDSCSLPRVRSVTVNRTLGDPRSIGWIEGRYSPDIVNMEGAAMFYVCLLAGVPFLELRAVSDMVGPRDKAQWDIPGAIAVLNQELGRVLKAAL
jgi:futalosine hydrolase